MRKTLARAMMIVMMIFSISPYYDTAFAQSNTGKALRAESIRADKYLSEVKENLQQSKCELIVKTKVGKLETFTKELKANEHLKMASVESYGDFQIVQVATETAVESAIEAIKTMGSVEWVQRNLPLKAYGGVEAVGQSGEAKTTEIDETLKTGTLQNTNKNPMDETALRGVLVGVLDSGINIEHPALKGKIYVNTNEIPENQLDDDGNGFIDDVNGWDFLNQDNTVFDSGADESHGTKIAGIIAGSDSSKEYRGLAPNATILPLKFMNGKIGYTSDAIAAIDYAQKMGVKIINGSFGGTDNNIALKKAIEASGILFVAAAGNEGKSLDKDPVYPAAYALNNVLTIGAMNDLGGIWSQSNYGKAVDAIAPGCSIFCPIANSDYGRDSGTSFAAAFATGLAAKLLGEKPELSATELRTALLETARVDKNLEASVSGGRVLKANLDQNNTLLASDIERTNILETTAPVAGNSKVAALGVNLNNNILEAIHFGEAGVNAATGNYSTSGTDYTLDSPGFDITFTRTYNSKDERTIQTLGKGWTFGFEGSIKDDPSIPEIITVKLPSGKVSVFKKNGTQFEKQPCQKRR
jgi:subtilisin family serine protease